MRDEVKASASFDRDSRDASPFFPGSAVFVAQGSGGNGASSSRDASASSRQRNGACVACVACVATTRASSSVSFETRLSDSSLCVFVSAAAVSAAAVSAAAVSANARSSASSEIASGGASAVALGPPPKTERFVSALFLFVSAPVSPRRRGWSSGTGTSGRGGNTPSYAERFEPATHEGETDAAVAAAATRESFFSAPQRAHLSRHPELACAHAPQGQSPAQRQSAFFAVCADLALPSFAPAPSPTAGHSSSGEAVESASLGASGSERGRFRAFSFASLERASRRGSFGSPVAPCDSSTAAEPSPSSDADEPPEQEDAVSSEAERGPAGEPSGESSRATGSVPSTWASMGASDDASRPRRARRRARSPVASVRCASDSPSRAASRDAGGFVGAPSTRLALRCRGVAPRGSSPARMAVRRLARACVRPPRTTINETSGRFSHLPRLGRETGRSPISKPRSGVVTEVAPRVARSLCIQ